MDDFDSLPWLTREQSFSHMDGLQDALICAKDEEEFQGHIKRARTQAKRYEKEGKYESAMQLRAWLNLRSVN